MNTMFRNGVVTLVVLAALLLTPLQAGNETPERVVRDTFDASLDALLEHHEAIADDPRLAEELIDEILAPRVHFELMSRLILGRYWNEADTEQQERFVEAFRANLIRTYARMLANNIDDALAMVKGQDDILRVDRVTEPDERGRVTVQTRLQFREQSLPVYYRLIRTGDDSWKAYDVVVENISFVTNYRQEYGSAIRRGGVEDLIQRLEARTRSGGSAED